MKALVLAPFSSDDLQQLSRVTTLSYESWTETRKLYDPEELASRVNREDIGILVVEADFLFSEVFEKARPLKLVGVCRNALNHIDVESATEQGVLVVNTPSRNAQAVAEHALGLMFSLSRRIPQAHGYVATGLWQDPVEPYISMRGVELSGKTLGIVGLGAIGRRLARMARALGMRVVGYDPYVVKPPGRVAMVGLESLLRESDFVSIHAPLTPGTEGLIDAQKLSLMKPTAYLVNTSEAAIVDQEALVSALETERIGGAAMDVFETHPVSSESPLLKLSNVVLTPHLGGATDGTVARQSRMMLTDILRFLEGKRPRNLVNPQAWVRDGR